ncbi:eukaryotic translation initiation factor 3 subunit A [Physocladia obscura]|uniref:Eukaryotic translation initiation factor 3 subunit A n=1 Tax=Physocladia obscura TaxID=109957 RepID=A0AAD5T5Y9_9FUNG|nr:eukaryotic translation initiation factor 3 subunit A [Physocladia obscura]
MAVNQSETALDLLHEVIMSKRSRSTAITTLEPVVLRFIELSVFLRKGKMAKEVLHQYKNISQNVSVAAIELVIKKFIDLSEAKVAEAQTKADKINLDNVDDLEALETPESIILSTVSGDVSKDRTDREVVTPWLKFLWESYRTALDILRNNSRLETLYQAMASQAFKFCLKYNRKTEFRRLCEILRQHLTTSAKYAGQTHSINLSDPETLQRHLDTRFEQLNAAAELELWQEGFRSVEDIHTLFIVSKKPPKAIMLANYYEKLARIFVVGENYLFHAAAFSKLFAIVRTNKNLPDEEHERMATIVLISALSIPIISANKTRSTTADTDDNKPRDQRLTNLLRVSKTPTRESLLKEALSKPVFSRIRPEVRELYSILEVDFHPLSICKKIAPIITKLSNQKDLTKYARPLHQVILTRLLQQLSQVYQSITIDSIVNLASFPCLNSNITHDESSIEKFIMNGCRNGDLSIRINHMAKTITFESDVFSGASGKGVAHKASWTATATSTLTPSELMRAHLTTLATRLNAAAYLINPAKLAEKREAQNEKLRAALESMEDERRLAVERVVLIEKRREIKEYEAAKKTRQDEIKRQEQTRRELEAEKVRMEEDMRRREVAKIAQIRADREREEAIKLAERIAGDGKNKNIKEELMTLDSETLMRKQFELLEQEKRDLASKTKQIVKKLDHTERAFRQAEIVKWEADYVEQKKIDKAYYAALKNAKLEAAQVKHAQDLLVKSRVTRMLPDYEDFKWKLDAARQKAYEAQVAEAQVLIEEAKAKRIAEVRKAKLEELARKNKEEEARRIFVENERIRLAESAKLAEEKAARDAAKKLEDAERTKKLDEIARRQSERERAIEEKLQRERSRASEPATPSSSARAAPSDGAWTRRGPPTAVTTASKESAADEGQWKRKEPAAPASATPSVISSGGLYVLPAKRVEAGGGGGGARPAYSSGDRASGSGERPSSGAFGQSRGFERRDGDRPAAFGQKRDTPRDEPSSGAAAGAGGSGGWRAREAAKGNSTTPAASNSTTSGAGKYVAPNRHG